MRPRQRARRNRRLAVVVALAGLGAAAFATLGHLRGEFGSPATLMSRLTPGRGVVEVVASSDAMRREAAGFLAGRARLSPSAQAESLKKEFPCLRSVSVRRDWLKGVVRLELELRAAAAPARLSGRDAGFLSDDGVVFEAPAGMYSSSGPSVETAGAGPKDLLAAARLVAAAQSPGALPARLESLRFLSAHDGWEARLLDGTTVLWGDGRWTEEKLARLREVLSDARSQADAAAHFAADLRYFEDGKVLLRPLPARSLSMR